MKTDIDISPRVSAAVRMLAGDIMARTIQGHYIHGLRPGDVLNLDQIAGEAVEAAIALDNALNSEEHTGSVSRVMNLNRAYRTGFAQGMTGATEFSIVNEDNDPEITKAAQSGFDKGVAEAKRS